MVKRALVLSVSTAVGLAGVVGCANQENDAGISPTVALVSSQVTAAVSSNGQHGADWTRPTTSVADSTPKYGGGPVLASVRIVTVYWGSNVDATFTSALGGFYTALVASPYLDWMREYNTATQSIGRGTYAGSTTITPTVATGTTVTEANLADELASQINAGKLTAPDANTLYMVHFPQGITITFNDSSCSGGVCTSCSDFCGFHNYSTRTINGTSTALAYGVIPHFGTGGCGCGDRAVLDNYTKTVSHEVAEAITDPQPFSGWSPEIGDACSYAMLGDTAYASMVTKTNTYTVQIEYSAKATGCVSGFEVPAETLAVNTDGRLELFYARTNGALYHKWQTTAGSSWSGEKVLGGAAKQVTVGRNTDGRLELIYVGTNDSLYHNWQTTAGGSWNGQSSLGGSAKLLTVAQNTDGRLELIYIGTDNALYHNWQGTAGGSWHGQSAMGGSAQQIAVAQNTDGRLELIYIGTDNNLYHNWQSTAGGSWHGASALGGSAKQITIGRNSDGRLELIYVGTDDNLYHNWQSTAGGSWHGASALGGSAKQVTVAQNSDGRLELVYIGTDNALYHNWQSTAGSSWHGQSSLGGSAKRMVLGQNSDGRLELIYVGTEDALYHNWQTTAGSSWNGQSVF